MRYFLSSLIIPICSVLFQALISTRTLKMALIYAHEHLGQIGERLGAAAMLVKIEQHRLHFAVAGGIRAVLCRSGNAIQLPSQAITITPEDYIQLRGGNATLSQVPEMFLFI